MKGRGLLRGPVLGWLMVLPATGHAQPAVRPAADPPADRIAPFELRVTARAGLLTPATWFYVEFWQFGAQPIQWTEAAVQQASVVAVAGEAAFEGVGLRVRVEAMTTIGGETFLDHAVFVAASQAGPAGVVRTRYEVPTAVTVATVDLALPLRLRLPGGIEPYVTAGAGGKRYSFDSSGVPANTAGIILPNDGTVAVVNVGAGGTVRLGRFHLDLLVRDAISEYWGEQQHDVAFLAGLAWRVR